MFSSKASFGNTENETEEPKLKLFLYLHSSIPVSGFPGSMFNLYLVYKSVTELFNYFIAQESCLFTGTILPSFPSKVKV
jgi:hypothetical protein